MNYRNAWFDTRNELSELKCHIFKNQLYQCMIWYKKLIKTFLRNLWKILENSWLWSLKDIFVKYMDAQANSSKHEENDYHPFRALYHLERNKISSLGNLPFHVIAVHIFGWNLLYAWVSSCVRKHWHVVQELELGKFEHLKELPMFPWPFVTTSQSLWMFKTWNFLWRKYDMVQVNMNLSLGISNTWKSSPCFHGHLSLYLNLWMLKAWNFHWRKSMRYSWTELGQLSMNFPWSLGIWTRLTILSRLLQNFVETSEHIGWLEIYWKM